MTHAKPRNPGLRGLACVICAHRDWLVLDRVSIFICSHPDSWLRSLGRNSLQVRNLMKFYDFFFSLHSNIATKSAYKISSRCLGRLKSYDLVGWIWVELTEISCQVSRSSPIFLIFFSLYSTIATESAYEVSSRCLGRLKCYDLVGWIWVKFHVR